MDWLSGVQRLRRAGEPGVLVTVTDVHGHAPRDPGAKMLVGSDCTWGSVGGGNLEASAISRAREMLHEGTTRPEHRESRLNEHARNHHGRQCCGGSVTLLLEPLPARPAVAIFGIGHVGYELARILSRLELQLHLVDSRPGQLDPLRLADLTDGTADITASQVLVGETVLERLPRRAHVLILTHDHAEDFALCDAALRLLESDPDRFGSIGMIGSSGKWARFQRNLAAEGHDPAAVAQISCPIGLPTITGKAPAMIAIAVAAGLVETLERAGSLPRLRLRSR